MSGNYCIFANIMTDEQIAAKKEHAGEKKASMKRRDPTSVRQARRQRLCAQRK